MQEKTFVGLYDTEDTLIVALEELRKKGIQPEDMYIIAKREEDVEVFRQRTYDEIQSVPSNWLDRFIGFISGENHVRSMLVEVGFDEADLRKYEAEIKQGKWLLYVEGEPKKTVYEFHAERYSNEKNPLKQSVTEAERLNRIEDDSVEFGKDGYPKNAYRDSVISENRAYTMSIPKRMTNSYRADNDPIRMERGHLGRAGGESLDTRTPSPSHLRQQRQAITQDHQHLHPFIRHDIELQNTDSSRLNETNDDVMSLHSSASHSPIPKETKENTATSTTQTTTMQHIPNKPIVIDLRGVNKDKNEVENWLIQDEEDLT